MSKQSKIGLVLSGGGARASYQAGVLEGIAEILAPYREDIPFPIITGISAGAINGSYLVGQEGDFLKVAQGLSKLWDKLTIDQVVRTDLKSLGKIGVNWIKDIASGGIFGSSSSTYLLETSPLFKLLYDNVDFGILRKKLSAGGLEAFCVSATNYATGTAVSFYEGAAPESKDWVRTGRLGFRARISYKHILASASIPILFPPVKVGGTFYGDGGVRLTSPLSPAIHLGSEKVLVIGIRHHRTISLVEELQEKKKIKDISIADIAGVLLNSTFLDPLLTDIERMERINKTLAMFPEEDEKPKHLREIPLLAIQPSQDLATLAGEEFENMPRILRHLLRGLGATPERGWDLLSYMAFEASYTRKTIELGRKDAFRLKAEILDFFEVK
ncbi:MAG: patatin-like phospholipase family protein [Pseudobdellovibrionaceae bacterium]